MRYKHIFFDLDRTLWDFDTNSRFALEVIYEKNELDTLGILNLEAFIQVYQDINEQMWTSYRLGNLSKAHLRTRRFSKTLAHFGYENEKLGIKLDQDYIAISPYQTALLPQAIETVGYLAEKYQLHIITNGFEEVQNIKLDKSGLLPFFKTMMTSERAMARKPDPIVFQLACKMAGANTFDSLMVGDDLEADIIGAKNVSMDQVYFNPVRKSHGVNDITHEITNLSELRTIL